MKQVINKRHGVFETNSSSTHSICIPKTSELIFPEKVLFEFGEFGWEWEKLTSVSEKASYLYTGLKANQREDDIKKMVSILESKNINVKLSENEDTGYVDHSGDLCEFLDAVMSDEDKLLNFLFSPLSHVLTGNDNDDQDLEVEKNTPNVECDIYFKGN